MVKTIGENVRGKAFRFGIFRTGISAGQRAVCPLFAQRNQRFGLLPAAGLSVQIRGNPEVLAAGQVGLVAVFKYRRDIVLNGR
jgi:hypothetical protein